MRKVLALGIVSLATLMMTWRWAEAISPTIGPPKSRVEPGTPQLIREFLSRRLKITGERPVLMICSSAQRSWISDSLARGLRRERLIVRSDTLCANGGPAFVSGKPTTALGIETVTISGDSANITASHETPRCVDNLETGWFVKQGKWQLTRIAFDSPRMTSGDCIPYTTKSNR